MPADPPATSGVFVVFEGGEGTGKSTQARALADAVRRVGRVATLTREPGGSPRAERIRELLLADESDTLDPRAEALLFAAARAEHVTHTIRPALARGEVVVSDRYVDSSVAYQGVARGLGAQRIRDVSDWATGGLRPDVTVVLDLDPAVGLARAHEPNRLEAEPLEFHVAVRRAFLDVAAGDDRCVVIAAEAPVDQVAAAVWQRVGPLLGTAGGPA